MAGLKPILLIEDSADDAELIQRGLTRARLLNPVIWLEDGVRGLEWLRRQGDHADRPPGCPLFVLLDVKLPGLNGHEVLAAIRADAELALVPVVMLTSSNEERDRLDGYRAGANAYVVKPVSFVELQRTVETLGYFWGILNQPAPG